MEVCTNMPLVITPISFPVELHVSLTVAADLVYYPFQGIFTLILTSNSSVDSY